MKSKLILLFCFLTVVANAQLKTWTGSGNGANAKIWPSFYPGGVIFDVGAVTTTFNNTNTLGTYIFKAQAQSVDKFTVAVDGTVTGKTFVGQYGDLGAPITTGTAVYAGTNVYTMASPSPTYTSSSVYPNDMIVIFNPDLANVAGLSWLSVGSGPIKPILDIHASSSSYLNAGIITVGGTTMFIYNTASDAWYIFSDSGGSAKASIVNVYSTPGTATWTNLTGAKYVSVIAIGGGGGGGSGRKGLTNTIRCGGGGGSGAGWVNNSFAASILGSTETVTVGAGGSGGSAQATSSTDGNNGSDGTASTFGGWLRAYFGTKGSGGTATTGTGGTAGGASGGSGTFGLSGASASTTGLIGSAPSSSFGLGAAGGGSGGGLTVANATSGGGAGGAISALGQGYATAIAAGTAGSAAGAGGNGGASPTSSTVGGAGGGGGGSNAAGNGGSGGNGGKYGSGGGGSGASQNGAGNSGTGGNGADGIVIVITQF